jgi:hypothetical protein
MSDALCLALVAGFAALCWALVVLCARLAGGAK